MHDWKRSIWLSIDYNGVQSILVNFTCLRLKAINATVANLVQADCRCHNCFCDYDSGDGGDADG